jgi:hypothetical protein
MPPVGGFVTSLPQLTKRSNVLSSDYAPLMFHILIDASSLNPKFHPEFSD